MQRDAFRVFVAAMLAGAFAYQLPRPQSISASASTVTDALLEGFFPAEGEIRWSLAHARIRFPDAPPGSPVRLEIELSGWRPRGGEPPRVSLRTGAASQSVRPDRRGESVTLEAIPIGIWNSDVTIELQSETFSPGRHDARALGVQFRGARLLPAAQWSVRRPPLRPLVGAGLIAFLLFALSRRFGATSRTSVTAGYGAGLALAVGQLFTPLETAVLAPRALVPLALATAAAWIAPRLAQQLRALFESALDGLTAGARALAVWPTALLALAILGGVIAAHRLAPVVDFEIGSDRTSWLAHGFGPFDARDGRSFRTARGATLDLRDFGGGASWRIDVTAAADGDDRLLRLASAQGRSLETRLGGGRWITASMTAPMPVGWRPGPSLTLAEGGTAPVRVTRVSIDRQGGWPALRLLALVLAASLALALTLAAAGGSTMTALSAAGLLGAAGGLALGFDPGVVIPFAPRFAAIVGGALLIAVAVTGWSRFRARHADPIVIAAAACGFIAWLACTTFPLYRGGHFLFHSAIAEEIWKGRFLIYYLPYPGSMLSQQAQWGNVIVPHPALYQTLVAPLAALPGPGFLLAEKTLLALLFTSLIFLAARLAARVGGGRAGAWTGVVFAALVPSYQLLGLGHLMTILGVWASSLAFGYLLTRLPQLRARRTWWCAVLLLSFCFVSYFAALLFTGLVLVLYLAWLWRFEPERAGPLFGVLVTATLLSFGLYYAYWFWPFLSESLPNLLGASQGANVAQERHLLARLASEPGKLDYSYGSLFVPLAGLVGLASLTHATRRERALLVLWGAILVIVSGMDLFFNFLLKHHYFVMVPVAVGCGALLSRLAEASRPGRAAALALLAVIVYLGADTALQVALGLIP